MRSVNRNGMTVFYREGTADEDVLGHSFDQDIFLTGMPEYKPDKQDIVLDVGAHIGTFSMLIAKRVSKVYAFEPATESFNYLERNIAYNELNNVRPLRLALSDKEGEAKLFFDTESGNWGHSMTKVFSEKGETVKTTSLEAFFNSHQILVCDFIKFNCEGAEFEILLHSPKEVLQRVKKMLVLFHADLVENYKLKDLISHLHTCGFYTELRKPSVDGQRGWIIVLKANSFQRKILLIRYWIKKVLKKLTRIG